MLWLLEVMEIFVSCKYPYILNLFIKDTLSVCHRELREKLRPIARLHSPDEHEIFVQGLLSKTHSFNKNKEMCDKIITFT